MFTKLSGIIWKSVETADTQKRRQQKKQYNVKKTWEYRVLIKEGPVYQLWEERGRGLQMWAGL